MELPEFTFTCPHCWQSNTVALDPADEPRRWTVDCTVCCRPIRLELALDAWTGRETLRVEAE